MRLLTLEIAAQLYAIDTTAVVEVAPLVELQPPPLGAPAWLTGRMLYRGALVPAIDLALLLGGRASPRFYSTRMVLTRIAGGALAALIAPKAVETVTISSSDLREPAAGGAPLPFLGPEILHARGVIRCLLPAAILGGPDAAQRGDAP